jgi:antirestriction protein ArdC
MLCGIVGIEQKTLENSAAYLKTWIARLKSDSRLLVSAASQVQKAADFIQGKAAQQTTEAQAAYRRRAWNLYKQTSNTTLRQRMHLIVWMI